MSKLTLYSNNRYYCVDYYGRGTSLLDLSSILPKLHNIYPKHITCYDNNLHFIMDISNSLHILKYTSSSVTLHDIVYDCPTSDYVAIKVHIHGRDCKLLLFSFDKHTSVFTMHTVHIHDIYELPINMTYKTTTKHIHSIESCEYAQHDSIILKGYNNDTYVYNRTKKDFDGYFNVEHKLYIQDNIYVEHNGGLYDTTDRSMGILTKGKLVLKLPPNLCYCYYYDSYYGTTMITTQGNHLLVNDRVLEHDGLNYVAIIGIDDATYIVYPNEIIFCNGWVERVTKVPDNGVISDDLITHGLTKQFKWTKDTHHYLSAVKRNVISAIIMCNRYTKYKRVPKYLLYGIINLFINKN